RLLEWYRSHGRDLPWRAARDPYAILVSEIMLQQTQVGRVAPAYQRFTEVFPSVAGLAAAEPADVLTAWRGLGYNRRALNLHGAARAIMARHGGRVPDDLAQLRALPGVGDYTARAVLSFAFERDAGPVDTNIARVLTRAVAGGPLTRAPLQRLADDMAAGSGPAWSHALMDLGALFCVASAPRCRGCPVRSGCAWGRDSSGGMADPAEASPSRSRPQGRFAGSTRYHRGRLVDALRDGPLPVAGLAEAARLSDDPARATDLAHVLVDEGLAEWAAGSLRLPSSAAPARAPDPRERMAAQ
ncbi:MAG TPA: hypothetical protein VML96_06730, partial [Egibacteraceae bacterium]|nr:hypothetical protein [Egibacteraceae bacterium]